MEHNCLSGLAPNPGAGLIEELYDILNSVAKARQRFEQMERDRGHIPTVCGMEDSMGERAHNWQDLLKQIHQNVYHLDSIVIELLFSKELEQSRRRGAKSMLESKRADELFLKSLGVKER